MQNITNRITNQKGYDQPINPKEHTPIFDKFINKPHYAIKLNHYANGPQGPVWRTYAITS